MLRSVARCVAGDGEVVRGVARGDEVWRGVVGVARVRG